MPDTSEIQQRAIAAYLGLAVGDALGATVEFMTPREIAHQYGMHREILGGGWLRLKPGMVTDDTTMSLALGDALLQAGRVDARVIANHFDAWMRNKPVDIGNTVRRGLLAYRRSGVTEVPESPHDAGNGACMRTLPAALFTLGRSAQEVAEAVTAQAHITHNNPLSDAATLCVVQMVQLSLQGATLPQLRKGPMAMLFKVYPEFTFRDRRAEENPSGYIVHTLRAVFSSLFETDSFESCLVDVVNRGGDADTTGAIAGMLAGAMYGLEALPERWLKRLDTTTAMRCREQAIDLLEAGRVAVNV